MQRRFLRADWMSVAIWVIGLMPWLAVVCWARYYVPGQGHRADVPLGSDKASELLFRGLSLSWAYFLSCTLEPIPDFQELPMAVVGRFIVAGFGLEKAGLRAHILRMKNRIGWTTCHSIGGKYAVAELLEGGIVGNGLITFATKEEAQKFIDSGKADALAARGAGVEPKDRK